MISRADLATPSAMSLDQVREAIEDEICVMALVGEQPAGVLFLDLAEASLHDFHVLPAYQGVGAEMVRAVSELAADQGLSRLLVDSVPDHSTGCLIEYGFKPAADGKLEIRLPARFTVPDSEAMKGLGARLAQLLVPGDMIIASGELGAGKTTFAQGLGAGLGVDGPVISPTFVLSRVHRNPAGPDLIHVDAYRLGSAAELEDLDLENQMENAITLIEWGDGLAEGLRENRLNLEILRASNPADQTRVVYLDGVGSRWADVDLAAELNVKE